MKKDGIFKKICDLLLSEDSKIVNIFRIVISIVFLVIAKVFEEISLLSYILYALAYIFSGTTILVNTINNIKKKIIFDENLLMLIATIGAIVLGEYSEACMVMVFYQIGEFLQDLAIDKSETSIEKLMDLRPDTVNLVVNGEIIKANPNDVKKGDIIEIRPGERVGLDCEAISGTTILDTSSLSGESRPIAINIGSKLLSGSVNVTGLIRAKVINDYASSTATKILDLIKESSENKSIQEKFITRFAKFYTPIVCGIAILIAFVPLLFKQSLSVWGYRALIFLVISCPCAIVISVPLTYFSALGSASKNHVLVKGDIYLELANKVDTIIVDKTGTLTKANFTVTRINPTKIKEDKLAYYATNAEYYSNHPIAKAISAKYQDLINKDSIKEFKEIPGKGISAKIDGKDVIIGKAKLLIDAGIIFKEEKIASSVIYVAVDKKYAGYLVIEDEIKKTSYEAIESFHKLGLWVVMLTGDNKTIAQEVARKLHIDEYHAGLLPNEKLEIMTNIQKNHKAIFIGDGINDALAIMKADIGISMGGIGQDAAIEASKVVIMDDDINRVNTFIKIAKHCDLIVKENIIGALLIKLAVMVLSAIGISNMYIAVLSDVGVALLAILNAVRLLLLRQPNKKRI